MSDLGRLVQGEDLSVDITAIERSLSDVWREQSLEEGEPVTRAALWNVVAHTLNDTDRFEATETLGRVSISVPQRSIVIRSQRDGVDELSSWIGANCHLVSGARQVCSEEISIVAGGTRIHHIPSLVNALLIPDMPVATWWLGDLPDDQEEYVAAILEPADRLIVDSVHFDHVDDLRLVQRLSEKSATYPADLNWVRLENWRIATASMFDPPDMRDRLTKITEVKIVSGESGSSLLGEQTAPLYYASWLSTLLGQAIDADARLHGGRGAIAYGFESRRESGEPGNLLFVEFSFEDGARVTLEHHSGAIVAETHRIAHSTSTVTRHIVKDRTDLIVRQLSQRERDPVFFRILPRAIQLLGRH